MSIFGKVSNFLLGSGADAQNNAFSDVTLEDYMSGGLQENIARLQGNAQGNGQSIAAAQYQNAANTGLQQQMAMAASNRRNGGLAQRQAMVNGSNQNSQMAAQLAASRLQEQQQRESQLMQAMQLEQQARGGYQGARDTRYSAIAGAPTKGDKIIGLATKAGEVAAKAMTGGGGG